MGTIDTELGLVLLRCKSLYSFLGRRKNVCIAPHLRVEDDWHRPRVHDEAAEYKLQIHLLQEQLYVRMCMAIVSTLRTEETVCEEIPNHPS